MINRVIRRMQAYPPEPQHRVKFGSNPILGRTIVRTGRTGLLGRSWKVEEIDRGYKIENTAARRGRAYARYVVGDAYGTGQNSHPSFKAWPVFRTVVDEEVAKLPDEVEDEIVMVSRRVGL
jgi:hypothetical protein